MRNNSFIALGKKIGNSHFISYGTDTVHQKIWVEDFFKKKSLKYRLMLQQGLLLEMNRFSIMEDVLLEKYASKCQSDGMKLDQREMSA